MSIVRIRFLVVVESTEVVLIVHNHLNHTSIISVLTEINVKEHIYINNRGTLRIIHLFPLDYICSYLTSLALSHEFCVNLCSFASLLFRELCVKHLLFTFLTGVNFNFFKSISFLYHVYSSETNLEFSRGKIVDRSAK